LALLPEPIERLVSHFVKLPGVGGKSARRMVFHLLQSHPSVLAEMASDLEKLHSHLSFCPDCGNIAEGGRQCLICADKMRDRKQLCVVENIEALVSFEQAGIYNGLYFVLGRKVSPIDDEDLDEPTIGRLRERVLSLEAKEVIVAMSPRIEGDLTWYAIQDALEGIDVSISRLAYGLPVGGSIEFADRVTLHTAFESRIRK
jgi:recombination protein RecR